MKPASLILCATSLVACGGMFQGQPDAGDVGGDASDESALADGGSTKCEAPSGVGICGGPNHCGAQCKQCFDGDAGDINVCFDVNFSFDAGSSVAADWYVCPDGAMNACADEKDAPECLGSCVTEDLPKLYLLNGRPDLARYSDRASYTGDPIPPPPTICPAVASPLVLCGGACGVPCNDWHHVCTGRSPLHPYSMCVPAEPESFPCARGNAGFCNSIRSAFMCLTYKVDSTAQPIADQNSLCVPSNICQAAAQSYPGGAYCTSGS